MRHEHERQERCHLCFELPAQHAYTVNSDDKRKSETVYRVRCLCAEARGAVVGQDFTNHAKVYAEMLKIYRARVDELAVLRASDDHSGTDDTQDTGTQTSDLRRTPGDL